MIYVIHKYKRCLGTQILRVQQSLKPKSLRTAALMDVCAHACTHSELCILQFVGCFVLHGLTFFSFDYFSLHHFISKGCLSLPFFFFFSPSISPDAFLFWDCLPSPVTPFYISSPVVSALIYQDSFSVLFHLAVIFDQSLTCC